MDKYICMPFFFLLLLSVGCQSSVYPLKRSYKEALKPIEKSKEKKIGFRPIVMEADAQLSSLIKALEYKKFYIIPRIGERIKIVNCFSIQHSYFFGSVWDTSTLITFAYHQVEKKVTINRNFEGRLSTIDEKTTPGIDLIKYLDSFGQNSILNKDSLVTNTTNKGYCIFSIVEKNTENKIQVFSKAFKQL